MPLLFTGVVAPLSFFGRSMGVSATSITHECVLDPPDNLVGLALAEPVALAEMEVRPVLAPVFQGHEQLVLQTERWGVPAALAPSLVSFAQDTEHRLERGSGDAGQAAETFGRQSERGGVLRGGCLF